MIRKPVLSIILIIAAFLLVTIVAYAQDGFDLPWNTVDGGGTHFSTGGDYTLSGGFWSGGAQASTQHIIALPLVIRNH